MDSINGLLGGESIAGGKLKGTGYTHWLSPNGDATNESGFNALPGGGRFNDGMFASISGFGYWWTSTELNSEAGWFRRLNSSDGTIY